MPVFETFFEIHALHGGFDASRFQMMHHRWRVHKLDLIGLSQDYEVVRCYTFDG